MRFPLPRRQRGFSIADLLHDFLLAVGVVVILLVVALVLYPEMRKQSQIKQSTTEVQIRFVKSLFLSPRH